MLRPLILAFATAALLATPSFAAIALFRSPDVKIDWSRRPLATLKCEDPKTIAAMTETIRHLWWPDNRPAFSPTSKVRIYSSRTVRAQPDRFECRIGLTISDFGNGSLSAEFSVHLRGGGKWDVYFKDID